MDPIKNPFSPGAGSRPPELVGRDSILEDARILIGRTAAGRPEKSILLTGLRGVGKTVLLNEIDYMARESGAKTLFIEAPENRHIGQLLVPHLRKLLYDLDRLADAGDKVRRGLAVLGSFISRLKVTVEGVEIGLDLEPEKGSADSGDLQVDLTNLLVAVAEAAQQKRVLVVMFIDEIQYFNQEELGALIMAMHRLQQRQLPFALVGAGLPVLPGLAGDSKSYAERLFSFPNIGPLAKGEAFAALREPAEKAGVRIAQSALEEIYRLTQGYPYFLQEWGYQAWNHADASPIELGDIHRSTNRVIERLDDNFFRVRFERLTPNEKRVLRAMAELGPGPHRPADVARIMGYGSSSSLSPVRSALIRKGMVYSPSHGEMAFTVPLFDSFMKRAIPEVDKPA